MGAPLLSTRARQVCSYEIMHPGLGIIRVCAKCIKGRFSVNIPPVEKSRPNFFHVGVFGFALMFFFFDCTN